VKGVNKTGYYVRFRKANGHETVAFYPAEQTKEQRKAQIDCFVEDFGYTVIAEWRGYLQ